jgi:CRISPR-associated protein Cmr3
LTAVNTILLQPNDVLFFRDGRPMGGASSGHGAAWPLPNVMNHAFHAALHRAGDIFAGVHAHRRGRSGIYSEQRDRRFGSLVTAGPFPVRNAARGGTWFFPRPADAADDGQIMLEPCTKAPPGGSSLTPPCRLPVVSTRPPSKEVPKAWWSRNAWNHYLGSSSTPLDGTGADRVSDAEVGDIEHTYGIGIDPETGTVVEGQFYSANHLRLREGFQLGVLATAPDKDFRPSGGSGEDQDLVRALLQGGGRVIIAGGQQRVCTASLDVSPSNRLPLPIGLTSAASFHGSDGRWHVKWILLSPAVWPEIPSGTSRRGTERRFHPGGWLPNWICPETGEVLLEVVSKAERDTRRRLNASGTGYASTPSGLGHLVAAVVPRPIPVTGWALPNGTDREEGGAKRTHLAVPAGAVYHFETRSAESAAQLAATLNWHGDSTCPTSLRNRRSTLMGEKGFGIGVCGTWRPHTPVPSP